MYNRNYNVPTNSNFMYRNSNNQKNFPNGTYTTDGDRFFFAPFLVGGLAGTALGYGLANNNQINNNGQPCCGGMMYPMYPTPYQTFPNNFSSFSNNYFY